MAKENYAEMLRDLLDEMNIPIIAVIKHGLGITSTAFYSWLSFPENTPEDRKRQVQDLYDTLKSYRDRGLIPADKNKLIWDGILYNTERNE